MPADASEPRALIFFVALHDVAAAGRARAVRFALEVAVNAITCDGDDAPVREELDVAFDGVAVDEGMAALLDLDAAADRRPAYVDAGRALGLHVTVDAQIGRSKRGSASDFDVPLHSRPAQYAGRPLRDPQVVDRDRAQRAPAHALVGGSRVRRVHPNYRCQCGHQRCRSQWCRHWSLLSRSPCRRTTVRRAVLL